MLELLLKAIGLGLIVSFSFGPAFWAVIQIGVDKGFKWGALLSIGVMLSDLVFIIVAYFGVTTLFSDTNKYYISIIGGLFLIGFGIATFLKKPDILKRRSAKYKTPKDPTFSSLLVKGFLLNSANPYVFFFWLGSMSFVTSHSTESTFLSNAIFFFGITLLVILSSDLTKSYIGHRFKQILKPRVTIWINRVIGVILFVSGVLLILRELL